MKKRLKLKQFKTMCGKVVFCIEEQTHRGREFGNDSDTFRASNGVQLRSGSHPDAPRHHSGFGDTLFVRGRDTGLDDAVMVASKKAFGRLSKAVEEYNEHFSAPAEPKPTERQPEILVFRAFVSYPHAAVPRYQVSELLIVGAETTEEARRIVKEAMTTNTCQIEVIPKTNAKEKGILDRKILATL